VRGSKWIRQFLLNQRSSISVSNNSPIDVELNYNNKTKKKKKSTKSGKIKINLYSLWRKNERGWINDGNWIDGEKGIFILSLPHSFPFQHIIVKKRCE
jgi:hypothetical protein